MDISVETLALPDNRLDGLELLDVVKHVQNFVEQHRPVTVLTHHAGDVNVDHRVLHEVVLAACRPQPTARLKSCFSLRYRLRPNGAPPVPASHSVPIGSSIFPQRSRPSSKPCRCSVGAESFSSSAIVEGRHRPGRVGGARPSALKRRKRLSSAGKSSGESGLAMRIGNRTIGRAVPPFVIAEMSGNHNQSLDRALAIVDAAADAGAHALKLQTYTADTMTLDVRSGDFVIGDASSPVDRPLAVRPVSRGPYAVGVACADLRARRERGMIGFSTPFDETAVDFLEALDVPAYKIASFENGDLR